MKKLIVNTLALAMTVTVAATGALAQSNGNAGGNGRGAGGGATSGALDAFVIRPCLAAPCKPQRPRRPYRKIRMQSNDGCECNIRAVHVGGGVRYVKDCYLYEPATNARRYCAPWDRSGH